MTAPRFFVLECAPEELPEAWRDLPAGQIHPLDLLLLQVAAELGHRNPFERLRRFALQPCRLKVAPGTELVALAGPAPRDCARLGLCFAPAILYVVRLDMPGLLSHEMAHLLGADEAEAQRVGDVFAR